MFDSTQKSGHIGAKEEKTLRDSIVAISVPLNFGKSAISGKTSLSASTKRWPAARAASTDSYAWLYSQA
jgi:hypothetical protein